MSPMWLSKKLVTRSEWWNPLLFVCPGFKARETEITTDLVTFALDSFTIHADVESPNEGVWHTADRHEETNSDDEDSDLDKSNVKSS